MSKIIEVNEEEYKLYDSYAPHVVQSTKWGMFRKDAIYITDKESRSWLMVIRRSSFITIGILSECLAPDTELIALLKEIAIREKIDLIKFEPLIDANDENRAYLTSLGLVKARDIFLPNTFLLNLQEEPLSEMFKSFSTSTRRNIRVAEKKSVIISHEPYIEADYKALDTFLDIQDATLARQNFQTHHREYFHKLYDTFKQDCNIFLALYEDEVIAAAITLRHNNKLYYPYAASLHKYIDTKSVNLLLYEVISYGITSNAEVLNLWGCLDKAPQPNDPLYGVHMFKQGYAGKHISYIGCFALHITPVKSYFFEYAYAGFWNLKKSMRKLKVSILRK